MNATVNRRALIDFMSSASAIWTEMSFDRSFVLTFGHDKSAKLEAQSIGTYISDDVSAVASASGPGRIVLPNIAFEWLKQASSGEIVELHLEDKVLILKAGNSIRLNMSIVEPVAWYTDGHEWTMHGAVNPKAVAMASKCSFAMSDSRPELMGVYLSKLNDDSVLFGGDGRVFCIAKCDDETTSDNLHIPARLVDLIVKFQEPAVILSCDKMVMARCGTRTVVSGKLATDIDWRPTIKRLRSSSSAKVITSDLADAARACHCLRGQNSYALISISGGENGLRLKSSSGVGSFESELDSKIENNVDEKIVGSDNLLRFLDNQPDDLTTIEFVDGKSGSFKFVSEKFYFIIQPIVLK